VLGHETGTLPIVPAHGPRRLGPRHLAIGARAGLVKPSTGFGLRRIQDDSAAIVEALVRVGRPWQPPAIVRRHRWYDALLLEVLGREPERLQSVFAALFARNPLERVLRFLDEATTPAEELQLIATLPARPFLEALPRLATRNVTSRG
jgi:lycopene beta-cyclase